MRYPEIIMTVIRTPELADILVNGISDGVPLRQLCRMNGVGKSAVYEWVAADAELAGRIARARVEGFDAIAEEALEIADDGTNDWVERENRDGTTYEAVNSDHIQRSKLRVETRLKLLSKWDPRRYGERVDHTSSDGSMSPRGLTDFYAKPATDSEEA